MRYYIADLHFGHGGLNNRMDNRKFEKEFLVNRIKVKTENK